MTDHGNINLKPFGILDTIRKHTMNFKTNKLKHMHINIVQVPIILFILENNKLETKSEARILISMDLN